MRRWLAAAAVPEERLVARIAVLAAAAAACVGLAVTAGAELTAATCLVQSSPSATGSAGAGAAARERGWDSS